MRKPLLILNVCAMLAACQPKSGTPIHHSGEFASGLNSLQKSLLDENLNPFSKAQWGLVNSGDAQNIELDQVTSYRVQARAGQDVNLPADLKMSQQKILVAVLDTGIDASHPDLKNRIHRNESECRALEKFKACLKDKPRPECEKTWMDLTNPEVDQDKNGYPLDCQGWSLLGKVNAAGILGQPEFSDDQGHGTHVAGIIAAERDNGLGVSGLSANVEILPVQVIGKKPSEPIKPLSVDITPGEKGKEAFRKNLGDMIARGVNYAIHSGAQVINLSLGWTEAEDSVYLRQVIAEAQARGIFVVAAAGNDSTRALLRPCSYPGVICVASHGPDGSLSHFSNYGSGVTVAAPGTNILSTYPQNMRSVRFRKSPGYEFLNGTSQAAPFVTALIAEMLAQGVPKEEILPRLILGARPMQAKLPLLRGAADQFEADKKEDDARVEKKWILSGLADLQGSLNVTPQSLILPLTKERHVVLWDLKSDTLTLNFVFKNHWKDTLMKDLKVSGTFLKAGSRVIRPQIQSLGFDSGPALWRAGEERSLKVVLKITDSVVPGQSRIPSDLDLDLTLSQNDIERHFVLESEILVPVSNQTQSSDTVEKWNLEQMPEGRTSLISIDQNLDGDSRVDYLAVGQENKSQIYYLLKPSADFRYQSQGLLKVNLDGENLDTIRRVITARLDWQNSSNPGYVLGLLLDRSTEQKDSALRLLFLNEKLLKVQQMDITNAMVKVPLRVSWMTLGNQKVPAWIGLGKDPAKKASVVTDWENPENREKPLIRFYYMTADGKYQSKLEYQGFYFLDTLSPSLDQVKSGRVPVILGKDRGTESKPSYIYDFAVAEMVNGQIENFQMIDPSMNQQIYRNLLDTKVDQILSLQGPLDLGKGTFWFGEGPEKTQRLSSLVKTSQGLKFFESRLEALRGTVDAALLVRAVYSGPDSLGTFVMTNSELQFHDLTRNQIISKSLERYTFIADKAFTNLHFPLTVRDRGAQVQLPGLMTTENSGINKGVKIKLAVRDSQGNLNEILSPAKLRFQSGQGCRALDNPTLTKDGSTAIDYYCGTHLLRMKLEY